MDGVMSDPELVKSYVDFYTKSAERLGKKIEYKVQVREVSSWYEDDLDKVLKLAEKKEMTMANDNETIEYIIRDIRENDGMCISPSSLFAFDEDGGVLLGDLAERIEVAHNREMAAKDAEIRRWRRQALEEDAAANALRDENRKLRDIISERT